MLYYNIKQLSSAWWQGRQWAMPIIILLAVPVGLVPLHPIRSSAVLTVAWWGHYYLQIQKKIKNMQKTKTIIDVRTPEEYIGGHVAGSINIPLNEIPERVNEIKKMALPVILCCASGNRSGQATAYLRKLGISCENGGSWLDLKSTVSQN